MQENIIFFSEWTQLVKHLLDTNDDSKIYRGHSNYFKIEPKTRIVREFLDGTRGSIVTPIYWEIVSSFDRHYEGRYLFRYFLSQQLEDNNFIANYGNYNYIFIEPLLKCQQLERLYFLQHYGIPTCFLDFTRNPLIALYFAINKVRTYPVYTPDSDGNPIFYPSDNLFISIFEINYKRISDLLDLKPIDKSFSYSSYGQFKRSHDVHFAFDITPLQNIEGYFKNYNLINQEGCFVLFDKGPRNYDLVTFIKYELKARNLYEKDLIKEYRLNYNEIFAKHSIETYNEIKLFSYLMTKNISGKNLFDDIQGLKYDLNFFYQ